MTQNATDARLYRVERWRDEELDVPLWHARTEHMAQLLARYLGERGERDRPLRLLDLGCGAMAAEGALARAGFVHLEYLPADCFPRDARTHVVDLDDLAAVGALPAVDVVLIGGVLEYLGDPAAVLRALAGRARYLFFSYCPRSETQTAAERKGWKNHYTAAEMGRLAADLGPDVVLDATFSPRAPKPVITLFVSAAGGRRLQPRCPLCGGRDSAVAHVGELPLRELRIRQETRVCRACGLTFEASTPDQDWAALYGDVWQRGALPAKLHRELYANDARVIGPGAGRSVFEVGCGCGHLLDELARLGWRTSGCDPERAAVEIARRSGHDVSAELFRPRPGLSADLVVLGDVLEHQADPRAMLRAARATLAPGGRCYVRVPELGAIDQESFGDAFGLQHRVWFTPETLRELLESEGLVVERQGGFARGQHALACAAEPRPWRRPAGEPERSLARIEAYGRGLRERRARMARLLSALAGREVALYGGGEHAAELLAASPLGGIASRVVDGNPELWGRPCGSLTVRPPAELRSSLPEVVVIASRAYQDEIARELQDLERRGVEIVALYGGAS